MNGKALNIKPDPRNEAALFQAAAQLKDGARSAFLEEACKGDSALRLRIEALLAAHDKPDGVLADTGAVESQRKPTSAPPSKTPL
jgi:hypothetical protein